MNFFFFQNTQLVIFPYPPQTPFNQAVTVQARDKDTLNAAIVFDIETSQWFSSCQMNTFDLNVMQCKIEAYQNLLNDQALILKEKKMKS
jgi:hypothetical protein